MHRQKTFTSTLLTIAINALLFITACEIDPDLTTDPRDNFVGTWTVNEQSALYGTNNYTAVIVKDPGNSTQVLIRNFYHFGMDEDTWAIPTISSITIPEQLVCNHTVKGNGTRNKNQITWSYTVNDGADIDQVTAVYTKQ
jgi:hypothetical protein